MRPIQSLCRAKRNFAFACQSKACVTTPLPILALLRLCRASPGRAVHRHRVAYPCLSVANIASHAAAKPDCALPLRGTSNLYSAVATHCIQSRCSPCVAPPSLCFATQLQVMPSLHTAVEAFAVLYAATQRHCYALQHHAVAVQCLSSPFGAMPLPRDTMRFIAHPLLFEAFRSVSFAFIANLSLRCEPCCLAAPLLCCADHGRSRPRHRA